jgi:hypothetical protein
MDGWEEAALAVYEMTSKPRLQGQKCRGWSQKMFEDFSLTIRLGIGARTQRDAGSGWDRYGG